MRADCSRRLLLTPLTLKHLQSPLARVWSRLTGACRPCATTFARHASSASSGRWKARQARDRFAKDAKVKGLMSRAAFKLLEINGTHKLFKPGNTVIDLGYAPGSWSQVAVSKTQPHGRVVGIDVIPAKPPRGVSTLQGDFLDPAVQAELREFVQDPERGRPKPTLSFVEDDEDPAEDDVAPAEVDEAERSYIDLERQTNADGGARDEAADALEQQHGKKPSSVAEQDRWAGRVVDVVLSDMSAPWHLTSGHWVKSVSNPHRRMSNTSGVAFRDHAGSMDLCHAALSFAFDVLRSGGHFVCKFYQGGEDRGLELKLRAMFEKVHREKPEASRDASKEAYFVAVKRRPNVSKSQIFEDG